MSVSRKDSLLTLLKEEPQDSFLNYALALELHKEGNTAEAIALIEKVIRLDENYLGAYLQLGQLYEEAGEDNAALTTYHKGALVARWQKNTKTLSELNQAILMLEE